MEEFGGSHGFHGELRSRGGVAIEFKGGSLRKLTANEGGGKYIIRILQSFIIVKQAKSSKPPPPPGETK